MPLGTALSLSAPLRHAARQGALGVRAEPAAALLSCAVWWEDEANPLHLLQQQQKEMSANSCIFAGCFLARGDGGDGRVSLTCFPAQRWKRDLVHQSGSIGSDEA